MPISNQNRSKPAIYPNPNSELYKLISDHIDNSVLKGEKVTKDTRDRLIGEAATFIKKAANELDIWAKVEKRDFDVLVDEFSEQYCDFNKLSTSLRK